MRWKAAAAGGYHDGENALADQLEGALGPGQLSLADRGFFSMDRWLRFSAAGAHLLRRVKNAARSVPFRQLRMLKDGSELVLLRESGSMLGKRRRDAGDRTLARLKDTVARLVCFTILTRTRRGRTKTAAIRVLTTLLDPGAFPAAEIAALYAARWQVETAFLHLKKTVRGAGRELRGRSAALARQEAWALLLVHNMIAAMAARAAAAAAASIAAVSFTAVLSLVRDHVAADVCCRHCNQCNHDPVMLGARFYRKLVGKVAAGRIFSANLPSKGRKLAASYRDRAHNDRRPETMRRLVVAVSSQSQIDQFIMPRLGIDFPPQMPYERWLHVGQQLAAVSASSAWCLGDWLNHGEERYNGRYREAVEQTALDYQTLRNYAWVARSFPLSRRRDTLSFAHHAEVASLPEPEQDFWLRKAEESSWSRNRLRHEVRSSMAERSVVPGDDAAAGDAAPGPGEVGPSSGPVIVAALIEVPLSPQQLESCQAAAGKLGRSVQEWASGVLDRAAREDLGPKGQ